MKPPVPGEIVLTIRTHYDGEKTTRKALFIQHVDYPDEEWIDRSRRESSGQWDKVLSQDPYPKGWWYVMEDNRPTYWLPPDGEESVYIWDGTCWRKQRWKHVHYEGSLEDRSMEDLSVPNPETDFDHRCDLVEEVYLPEGENPS